MRRQLRVLYLAAKIVAWPIVRGLLRFLFFWVLVLVWLGSVGIVLGITKATLNSDSPPALQIAGLVAQLFVAVGGAIALVQYLNKFTS